MMVLGFDHFCVVCVFLLFPWLLLIISLNFKLNLSAKECLQIVVWRRSITIKSSLSSRRGRKAERAEFTTGKPALPFKRDIWWHFCDYY